MNDKLNGFDIIYWINLDRSKNRFINMTKILSTLSVKNIRIPAIDGKTMSAANIYNNFNLLNNIPQLNITPIEYACLLSHLNTIKTFSESQYEIALILEDDVSMEFNKYWNKTVQDVIDNAPNDWDIIMLSYTTDLPYLTDYYTLNKNGYIPGAFSYLIRKESAVKFINSIYTNNKYTLESNITHTADIYLFSIFKTYVYKYPFFTYPDDNDSTIHPNHLNHHMISKNNIKNLLINKFNTSYLDKSIINKYINGIDIIYWINMDNSKDNYINMMNIFEIIPIKNIRINLTDNINNNIYNIYNKFNNTTFTRSITEYGCLLSHLETINKFSKSKYNICLILEDNISLELIKYWNKSINTIIADAPTNWEIIMLTYMTDQPLTALYTYNTGFIYSTGAYIINKKAAGKFINNNFINDKFILNSTKIHTTDKYLFSSFITYAYKYPYFIHNNNILHVHHIKFKEYNKNQLITTWEHIDDNNNYNKNQLITTWEHIGDNNNYNKNYILLIFIILIIIIFIFIKHKYLKINV